MIPFSDLPLTFLGVPVTWRRAERIQAIGVFTTQFMLGELPVHVGLDCRGELPKGRVTVQSRPGVAIFVCEGAGSLEQLESATKAYTISVAMKLAAVAEKLIVVPPTVEGSQN